MLTKRCTRWAARAVTLLPALLTAAVLFLQPGIASAQVTADQMKRLKLQHRLDYQVPLSQATWISSHNTYNATAWGYPFPNHEAHMNAQLDMGIRGINFDVHSPIFPFHPIVERLCHFAGDGSLTCSPTGKKFSDGLQLLNNWLNANPGEVVLLLLEDYIKPGRHSGAADSINHVLGAKVFRSLGGGCRSLPIATLTKQKVLDAGKQLIIATADGCKNTDSNWRSWVWDVSQTSHKADAFKTAHFTRSNSQLNIVYEDRSIFGVVDASNHLDNTEVAGALAKGAAIIALDKIVKVNRHEGAIWSWDVNQPDDANNEDCAVQHSNGRWNDVSCSASFHYACQGPYSGDWRISNQQGVWSNGNHACQSLGGYLFSVPVNATENAALHEARVSAGISTVFLNHNDQANEGVWSSFHRWNDVIELLTGDWNNDGKDTIAVRRGNVIAMDFNGDGVLETEIAFGNGNSEDEYLVGDWDGDGDDNIAVRRGNLILMNYDDDGQHDREQYYGNGNSDDEYLVGNWDGDNDDDIAIRVGNLILMDYNGDGQHDHEQRYGNGNSDDEYLVGDWDGDGTDNIAIRQGNLILMDYNGDGLHNREQRYGNGNSNQYLVGNWDGDTDGDTDSDTDDDIAIVSGNRILMDTNGDGAHDDEVTISESF